jgi:protoporphyrinogen oxidase
MNICIVGAGPTGLTAGYELAQRGHRVSLFEREERYGRLIDTIQVGDKRLEKFYHHLFTSDGDIIDLIEELNLSSELSWLSPRNGMYINHKILPFSSPADLFSFTELSLAERFSLGSLLLKARLITNWKKLEDVTAKEWVIKQSGEQVYRKMWEPLLHSKFDRDAERISAAWLWSRIKLRSETRKKTLHAEMLGYMNGAFMAIYDALASRIKKCGGTIECSHPVSQITPHGDGSLEVSCNGRREHFEAVILTSAPSLMLDMGLPLPAWYRESIAQIKYKAHICMLLELTQPLSAFYWIAVTEKEFPFIAVVEHTNLVPVNGYRCHLVYLSRYVDEKSDLFLSSDESLQEHFIRYLTRMFPQWNRSTIINIRVNRARYVQPVICTGYSRILPPLKTPIENLYLASMAQIYPEDRGQNCAVKMGKTVAHLVDKADSRSLKNN